MRKIILNIYIWLWKYIKTRLSRFVPAHINNPFKLMRRMLISGNKAAWFTLWLTGLGVILSPIDWALQFFDHKTRPRRRSCASGGPYIFICGPARSGTTLVFQVLSSTLEIAYPRNFTAMFSRSPLLAMRLFSRDQRNNRNTSYQNYYGKTVGLQGPSEANHLWNQWVDSDISGFRTQLHTKGAEEMASFFEILSQQTGLPTLAKNNNINAFANAIASRLDNSYFICLRRDSRFLAQSLVKAREEINGDMLQSYGVTNTATWNLKSDPLDQVVSQIEYMESLAIKQQQEIGEDRFWIVEYEAFCANPEVLVNRVRRQILQKSPEEDRNVSYEIPTITNSNRVSDLSLFRELEERLGRSRANLT